MQKTTLFLTLLVLTGGYGGLSAQNLLPSNDSLALMTRPERLLEVNRFIVENPENHHLKAEPLQRLYMLADSLDDRLLREYVDFYKEIFPALAWKDPDRCIRLLTDASHRYEAQGKKRFAGICLHMIGQHHYMCEAFGPAFENLLKANDLFREVGYGNIPEIGRYLHELALAHYYFRDYYKVMDLMHAAVRLPAYNRNLDMQRFNNLALAYRNTGQLDSALHYIEHTLHLAEQYGDSVWISIAYGNLGSIYHRMGLFEQELKYREADYRFRIGITSIPGFFKSSALGMAETWLKLGNPEKAGYYLTKYRETEDHVTYDYSGSQHLKSLRKIYLDVAHQYYSARGDFRVAYRYLDSLRTMLAEEDMVYHKLIATTAQQRIDIQRQQSRVLMLRQEQEHLKVRYGLLIAGVSLLMVVFALLYYLTRLKKQKEQAEYFARQKTDELEKLTMKRELSEVRLELRDYLLRIQENENLIDKLSSDLKALNNASLPGNGEIRKMEEDLRDIRILTNQHWDDFQQRFAELYADFSTQLRDIRPRLTQGETRLLLLTRIGLSNKEMAHALGVLPDAIRVIRYRLKKKYGIPADAKLPDALIG